jgi:hypothetical protein
MNPSGRFWIGKPTFAEAPGVAASRRKRPISPIVQVLALGLLNGVTQTH